MLGEGVGRHRIAAHLDKSLNWVDQVAVEYGLNGKTRTKITTFEVLYKLLNGMTVKSLSEEYKVSDQYVSEIKSRAVKAGFKFSED